mgnify:CR=1 FL=1
MVSALRRRERLILSDATSTAAHLNPRLWLIHLLSVLTWNMRRRPGIHIKRDIAELEKVQRRAARFAKSDYRRTTSVTELLSDLKWEPLSLRRKNTRLAMLFKATHGLSAVPLDGLCRPVRNTRSSKSTTFVRLPSRTDSYKNSFFQEMLLTGIRCPTLLVLGRLLMRSVMPCLPIWPSHRAAANFSLP